MRYIIPDFHSGFPLPHGGTVLRDVLRLRYVTPIPLTRFSLDQEICASCSSHLQSQNNAATRQTIHRGALRMQHRQRCTAVSHFWRDTLFSKMSGRLISLSYPAECWKPCIYITGPSESTLKVSFCSSSTSLEQIRFSYPTHATSSSNQLD